MAIVNYYCVHSSFTEQILRDEEQPSEVHASWKEREENVQFLLRERTSGLVRVHHQLGGDYQSFQSLIITPTMTCQDVLQLATGRLAPGEGTGDFVLVLRTAQGGEQCVCVPSSI